ncbi:MAG TPA: hypothetical protein VGR21_05130 [Cryptosporangiaceae bacterium]|nr:hypothetical protein [Cryptosporangiaceae bacterium]
MSVLGIVFLLVVLAQTVARDPVLEVVFSVAGWLLWAVFAGEYALRLYVAPRRGRFLRRTWWQLIFLLVPFLRFLRLARALRFVRAGGVLTSAVRGGRSAGRLLSGRVAWLGSVTVVVILATSQLLYTVGGYPTYGQALHDAALGTITGEPLSRGGTALGQVVEVALAAYSVVVFASLAATLGAYFLSRDPGGGTRGSDEGGDGDDRDSHAPDRHEVTGPPAGPV